MLWSRNKALAAIGVLLSLLLLVGLSGASRGSPEGGPTLRARQPIPGGGGGSSGIPPGPLKQDPPPTDGP